MKQSLLRFFKSLLSPRCYGEAKSFYFNFLRKKSLKINGHYSKNTFFFIIDPNKTHPGLADRIKAIIHCYNIAKFNGYQFKIIFKVPFCLEEYLKPNKVNWIADYSDLGNNLLHVKLYNETDRQINDNILAKGFEYECFNYSGNLIPFSFNDSGEKWSDLFCELFKPDYCVSEMLNNKLMPPPLAYVAVHFRFVNALEHFEDGYHNELSESKKENLIKRCKQALMTIKDNHPDKDIIVFSDSKVFIDSIKDLPVKTLGDKNIGHIRFNNNKATVLKTFFDLFMISRASKVFVIHAPEMYNNSCFALLGARISGIECDTINV